MMRSFIWNETHEEENKILNSYLAYLLARAVALAVVFNRDALVRPVTCAFENARDIERKQGEGADRIHNDEETL